MSSRKKVTIRELRMTVSVVTAYRVMGTVLDYVRGMEEAERASFIWSTYGAVVHVYTEGSPKALAEFATWALCSSDIDPREIDIRRQWTFPLSLSEGWNGHINERVEEGAA